MKKPESKSKLSRFVSKLLKNTAMVASILAGGTLYGQSEGRFQSTQFGSPQRQQDFEFRRGFVPPNKKADRNSGQLNRAGLPSTSSGNLNSPSIADQNASSNATKSTLTFPGSSRNDSQNDSKQEAKVFKAYSVTDRDVSSLAKSLEQKLGGLVEVVSDERNNRLLVSCTPTNHRLVQELLKKPVKRSTDQRPAPYQIKSIRSFNVDSSKIRVVADEISQLYSDPNRVIVAADEVVGKLMVFSTELDYTEISKYLGNKGYLDRKAQVIEKGEPRKRVHALKNVDWRVLENALLTAWGNSVRLETSTDGSMSRMQLPKRNGVGATILVDRRSSQVQIESVGRQLDGLIRILEVLDQRLGKDRIVLIKAKPEAIDQVQSTVSMFKFAALQQDKQPKTTSAIIGKKSRRNNGIYVYQESDQENPKTQNADDSMAPIGRVEIITIPGTDIIILKGEPDDVERVRKLIEKIEQTSEEYQPQIEVIPLQHIDNIAVQAIVDQVYTAFYEPSIGDTSITALVKPNALLVVGPQEGVKQVREIIKKLDVSVNPSTEFKVFRIKHMSAVDLESRLRSFYLGQSTGGGIGANAGGNQNTQNGGFQGEGLAARLRIASDYRSNTLFIHASPRDMIEITKFVAEIDVESPTEGVVDVVRVVRLKNSIASELAPILQEVLNGQLQGAAQSTTGGQNNTIGNLNQNNQGFSQVRAAMLTLQALDPGGKMLKSSILFDTRITADDNSNSLVIKAPKGSIDLILVLVSQLDSLPEVESRIKVFELENASAIQVVETIQNFFETTQGGGGGAGGGTTGGTGNIPLETGGYETTLVSLRLAADARSNTVIAAGSSGDLNIIDALIARLDEDVESEYVHKVYRLQNVTAETVQTALNGWLEGRTSTLAADPRIVGTGDGSLETVKRAITVQAETETNSLIVSAHKEYLPIIDGIIRDIDFKKQIVIQAAIVNVQLGDQFELGIEWGVQDSLLFNRGLGGTNAVGFPFNNSGPLGNDTSAGSVGIASRENLAGQVLSNLNIGRTSTLGAGFGGLVVSAGNESINVLLRALQAKTKVDVLQRPQITTMENIQAFIQVGQDLPYITGVDGDNTAGGTTAFATEFLELGVTLAVTPRIRPNGEIWMRVDVSNSSVADGAGVVVATTADGGTVTQPIINDQTLQTDVTAHTGQTIILGGLIQKSTSNIVRGLPFFSNIPAIGRLFRFESVDDSRSELIVILRPIILDSPEDRAALKEVELARMNWCLSDVIDLHGPVYEDENLAGDTDTVYPDRTPTLPHREANLENRNGGLKSTTKDSELAPLNDSASFKKFNAVPLPNENRFQQSGKFATRASANDQGARSRGASTAGFNSENQRTETVKKKKKNSILPFSFKKKKSN